ncbi:MAG: DUF3226 domain-containing protein [Candidatus Hydrogenedentota bacterium]
MKLNSLERPSLHVEGKDDEHFIRHLLFRHGFDYDKRPLTSWYPEIKQVVGIDNLLPELSLQAKVAGNKPVGFVFDANTSMESRWQSVVDRLTPLGFLVPRVPPADGFIGDSADHGTRVGVWVMPDNKSPGSLEDFLRNLIAEADPLIEHAHRSTQGALNLGAAFPQTKLSKATIHAWLAWQEDPGVRYGVAIRNRYFIHDSEIALRFVHWVRRLVNPQSTTEPDKK